MSYEKFKELSNVEIMEEWISTRNDGYTYYNDGKITHTPASEFVCGTQTIYMKLTSKELLYLATKFKKFNYEEEQDDVYEEEQDDVVVETIDEW